MMWVYRAGGWNAERSGALVTADATTSSDGVALFSLGALAPGDYDLQLKGTHTLSRLLAGVSLGAGTNVVQVGTLSEGDVNGDDVVGDADFQFVSGRCPRGYTAAPFRLLRTGLAARLTCAEKRVTC
ncbi:MAG: hypothetical protein M1582_05120 [Actinobacteria bacterium]|nr:hypothetical protein [Actinomycetota bacterium]